MNDIKHPDRAVSHTQAIDCIVWLHTSASGFVNGTVYDHTDAIELQPSSVPPSPFDKS
ncbi:hypothetical protein QN400_22150 [Pseudomonas sp. RTC3]|uniref:hypothetical protein n=1 Tax=unclassified Pseudomonas TaxID=196821 RepID=UPI002AB526DA|nr:MULTISPECIES: hypothetical protein [unclassified Pseudomonas]MEB0064720.1 hypothetical protein [Pseudomonas sp. RTC3]MDY7565508.1 hypothetical protein [Pseudomonas sp. 5C2]MEB0008834.1 hypothetical protein [Pseudomonas sp. RTB2]MEB0019227.1 hypothetical protein [Pseudomonas sp. RTB3]MEB0027758.1 hypothetical protein [Pseudomonas sp. MH9.2]